MLIRRRQAGKCGTLDLLANATSDYLLALMRGRNKRDWHRLIELGSKTKRQPRGWVAVLINQVTSSSGSTVLLATCCVRVWGFPLNVYY